MFCKVPQSLLGILRVPKLPPPLEHPPLKNPTIISGMLVKGSEFIKINNGKISDWPIAHWSTLTGHKKIPTKICDILMSLGHFGRKSSLLPGISWRETDRGIFGILSLNGPTKIEDPCGFMKKEKKADLSRWRSFQKTLNFKQDWWFFFLVSY